MVREHRVGVALERLVASGVISGEQRGAVLRAVDEQERAARPSGGRVAAEIVAYVGAGLVAAGLGLFVDKAWAQVAQSGRVVLLVVVAGCAMWGAVALAGGCAGVFRRVPIASAGRVRLASVLLVLAAGASAGAVATAFGAHDGDETAIAASIAGLLVAALGYLLVPGLFGMVAVAGFGVASILSVELFDVRSPWEGIALMVFGALWFGLAWARLLVAEWAGYLLGGVIAVIGAQSVTFGESLWRPGLTALIGVLCFVLYALRRDAVLVLGGAAGIAVAVVQVAADYTAGGPVVACVVLGIGALVLTAGVVVLVGRKRGPGV
ncbi:DUF2157 domain-containing protein [Nocardia sp. NPDC058518]|uniref:DUF2157 domain-containing protein n=1 Tax=Nocardia sp. NPDC058518 TaxID=3346534 RepID=UPI00366785F0